MLKHAPYSFKIIQSWLIYKHIFTETRCWFLCYVWAERKRILNSFVLINMEMYSHIITQAVHLKQNLTQRMYSQARHVKINIKQQTFSCTCNLISLTSLLFRLIISLTHLTLSLVCDRAPVMVSHVTPTAFYLFTLQESYVATFP